MTTDMGKNIAEMFSALPESVKEWLASEELVFIITEIETKLGLSDEKILVIPNLILRLIVQDIEPQEFITELSKELGVEFPVAKTIAEDIERKALRPIETELRNKTGLEIKLIFYGKTEGEKIKNQGIPPIGKIQPVPSSLPKMSVPSASSGQAPLAASNIAQAVPLQTVPAKPISPLTLTTAAAPSASSLAGQAGQTPLTPEKKAISAPTPQSMRKDEPLHEAATPFILHQEGSPTAAPTLNQSGSMTPPRGPQTGSLPKTSLTMKVQNYFQSAGIPERPVSKPISIKVEAPAAQQAITQTEQKIPVMKQPAPSIIPVYTPVALKEQPRPASAPAMPSPSTNSPAGQAPSVNSGQARVVNYSNLRTPITDMGLPKKAVDKENIVDLRKFM